MTFILVVLCTVIAFLSENMLIRRERVLLWGRCILLIFYQLQMFGLFQGTKHVLVFLFDLFLHLGVFHCCLFLPFIQQIQNYLK